MNETNTLEVSAKKAGVDFGLTLVKACWIGADGVMMYVSTADLSRGELVTALVADGITDLCVGGCGSREGFERFRHHHLVNNNPMTDEVALQSNGAIHLLRESNVAISRRHLIVSIGTGTSFTLRDDEDFTPLLGSATGAGTVDALMRSWGWLRGAASIDGVIGEKFQTFDIMLGDVIRDFAGTPFVASSFGLVAREWQCGPDCFRRLAASAVSLLITAVGDKLMQIGEKPGCEGITDVIILGTLPTRSRVVREQLEKMLAAFGKTLIFPPHGEYALAVGAYHDISL